MPYFPDGAGVTSISGKTGDVVLRASDIISSSGVPSSILATGGVDTPFAERAASSQNGNNTFVLRDATAQIQIVVQRGPTANRPGAVFGRLYFDSTLGILIAYDGTNWVNGVGTIV